MNIFNFAYLVTLFLQALSPKENGGSEGLNALSGLLGQPGWSHELRKTFLVLGILFLFIVFFAVKLYIDISGNDHAPNKRQ